MSTTSISAESAAWTVRDAAELYQISAWSQGYFAIGTDGHLQVRPDAGPGRAVDLHEIVQGLTERGLQTPVLIRFPDILEHRLQHLHDAFDTAIGEHGYRGRYTAVYPIKVNQQRPVVEEVLRHGEPYEYGLEVGSKPELLAVMAMTGDADGRLIICNGFKDDPYIEATVLARKLGREIIPVVENTNEFRLLMKHASRYGVRPAIGVRVKLASSGAGRWSESSGQKSKFGLFTGELLGVLAELRRRDMTDCLELLHCHPGSQISDIRALKEAVGELVHIFAELVALGAGLRAIDVGGGLGVDYDGSESASHSSINYSLAEYANEVVYRVGAVCDERGIEHPRIISESGRALTAYQSVLVFDVLGSSGPTRIEESAVPTLADLEAEHSWPQPLRDLVIARQSVDPVRAAECFHDAVQAREQCMDLFGLGYLDLSARAMAEGLFWDTLRRVQEVAGAAGHALEAGVALARILGETYFCNLSIFQSLPDAWAIEQLFPIMPIHRLDERPSRRGVIADITCDSDGRIDRFVDAAGHEPRRLLELHELRPGEPYYLGAFLVGAYQETLGDLHNLFGDTHVVHIGIDEEGGWTTEEIVEGDTAAEVLAYVQYDVGDLSLALRRDCERAVRDRTMTPAEIRALLEFYQEALDGYTYLASE